VSVVHATHRRPPAVELLRSRPLLLALTLPAAWILTLVVLRGSTLAPVAAVCLAVDAFVFVKLSLDVLTHRSLPLAWAGFGLMLTPALVRIVMSGGRELEFLLAFAGAILALIVLTPHPVACFAGWLFLAPLLQLSARANPLGYWLNTAFYLAPPLLFVLWTVTPSRTRVDRQSLRFIDFLPVAYLLLAGVSLAFSSWAKQTGYKSAIDQLYQNVGIGVVAYYFLAFGVSRRNLAQRFAAVLLASGVLVSLTGIVERATGWTLWGRSPAEDGRIAATLSGPAVYGAYVGAALAVATAILLWRGPERLRLLSVVMLIVGIPASLLTITRGSILATLIVMLAMVAVRRSGVRWIAAGAAILAGVVLVLSWSSITSSSLYRNRFSDTKNVQGRLLIDRWSIKLFEGRPVLGYGYGSFDAIKNSAQLSPGKLPLAAGKDYTSHNTFLTILVELGAVGLGVLVLPWVVASIGALRAVLTGTTDVAWLLIGCVGIVANYAITALSTDFRFFSIVPAVTWMAVGAMRAVVGPGNANGRASRLQT